MTPEEFRAAGHQIVDWIADYRARVDTFPVMARRVPGEIKQQLPALPPDAPEPFDEIVRDLDRIVVPGLSHWQHPSFFGYFPSNGSLSSVLGDYVSTGLGVLGLAWQSSPALTEIEEVVTDWMRTMLGLSGGWSGVIQDTASTALVARSAPASGPRQASPAAASNRGRAAHGLRDGHSPAGGQAALSRLLLRTSAWSRTMRITLCGPALSARIAADLVPAQPLRGRG